MTNQYGKIDIKFLIENCKIVDPISFWDNFYIGDNMSYNERKKQTDLDYDVYIRDIDNTHESSFGFVQFLKQNYDVVFCSPQKGIPSFDDNMYLLPKLKDSGSSGYDVSVKATTILNETKRVELGVKSYLPPDLAIEMKNRSSTYKKYGVMLTNAVGEIDSSFRLEMLAEYLPIRYLLDSKHEVPVLNQFEYANVGTRIDYLQLKLTPVLTHTVQPIVRTHKLKVVGIVCQEVFDNFHTYFTSDRKGGFGSTDVVLLDPTNKDDSVTKSYVVTEDVSDPDIIDYIEYVDEVADEDMSTWSD